MQGRECRGTSWDCEEEALRGGDGAWVGRWGWEHSGMASFVGGRLVGKNSRSQHLSSTYYMPGTCFKGLTHTIFTKPFEVGILLPPILQIERTEA